MFALVAAWLMMTTGRSFDDVVGNWDVQHFLAIAREGYVEPNDAAFFPGWPLLLRFVGLTGVPLAVVGCLLALLCSGAAAAALYRIAGTAPAIAWLLAPTAVFTAVPYTEALFCAAAFWAWERASARRWAQAALLASVAASVRVSGVFLIGALAILALTQRDGGDPPARQRWTPRWPDRLEALQWLLLPTAVVGAYVCFLYGKTGSWTAWLQAQTAGWAREFTTPWEALRHTLDATAPGMFPLTPAAEWVFKAEIVSMAVGLLITVYCLVRRHWAEAAWVGVQVLAFSISYWFMSVNRAVLLWFPLWILLGRLAEGKGDRSRIHYVGVGAMVLAALVAQATWAYTFMTGDWSS